jgi:hypothetical protein
MSGEMDHVIVAYKKAYRAANPTALGSPIVDYSRGWFTIRNHTLTTGTKHRRAEIETMIARLNERAEDL